MRRRRHTDWISLSVAAQLLGITRDTFLKKHASSVTQQHLPEMPIRYCRAEVERMAEAAIVRPSRNDAEHIL